MKESRARELVGMAQNLPTEEAIEKFKEIELVEGSKEFKGKLIEHKVGRRSEVHIDPIDIDRMKLKNKVLVWSESTATEEVFLVYK